MLQAHSQPENVPVRSDSTPIPLSAIVLAGGQSSRMGQDKALLQVGETSLLQRICQVAQHCSDTVYVVTPWIERYRSQVDHQIHFIQEHPIVSEPIASESSVSESSVSESSVSEEPLPHGPLVGFAQALQQIQQIQQQQIQQQENPLQENPQQQAQTEWVLLLACDLPYLQAKVLQDWASQLPAVAASTIALLPQNPQGWWEPLCGFYRLHCLPDLEAFIAQGGRSFQGWLATQKVQPLPLANPQMLFNCNTPQDFSQI